LLLSNFATGNVSGPSPVFEAERCDEAELR
jgi:hypothetical protein